MGLKEPVIVHYGHYERQVFKAMAARHGEPAKDGPVAKAIAGAKNLVSIIYDQIYFPTFSNGLKHVASSLGLT